MRYTQEFIDKVMESADLVEIISQHTPLKHSGGGFMGRCPFPDHKEKTASFSVSQAKQVYHCFGCKKSGNVFSFLRDFSGFSFTDAIEYLADKANLKLPEPEDQNKSQEQKTIQQQQVANTNEKKKNLLKISRMAADFFKQNLSQAKDSDIIKKYIQSRGLNQEIISEFEIGFVGPDWAGLVSVFEKKNIELTLAEEAKLVRAKKDQNGYYDLFRERLIFPIHSLRGEVIAFGGRIYDQGEPKYLNSPESLLFHKGKILYGLFQSAKFVRSEDSIILVEGYMDMVSLYQAGIKNCVATMGTALTEEQAKLIKRITTNVFVLFDSDQAGQAAAERSLSILLSYGLYPKGVILEKAKDPDEFVKKFGPEALKQVMASSPDLFKLVLRQKMADYNGESSQKVQILDQIGPLFSVMSDQRLAALYKQDFASKLSVTEEWLSKALGQTKKDWAGAGLAKLNANDQTQRTGNQPLSELATEGSFKSEIDSDFATQNEPVRQKIRLSKATKAEKILVSLLLKSRANMAYFLDQMNAADSTAIAAELKLDGKQILSQVLNVNARQILEKAQQVYRQDLERFDKLFSLLIDKIDEPQILFVEVDEQNENKLIGDAAKKIQQDYIRWQTGQFKMEIKKDTDIQNSKTQSAADEIELHRKLKEFEEIHKSRLRLKK